MSLPRIGTVKKQVLLLALLNLLIHGKSAASIEDQKEVETDKTLWKKKLIGGIHFTQSAYSNWAKGGQNAITWSTRLDGDFSRNGGYWDWRFTNSLLFGQTKQENEKVRTTLDKIDIDATIASKSIPTFNPYFSFGLLTQFSKGYDYKQTPPEPKSDFFDPAYLTQSLGARLKVKTILNSHLGIGFKQTVTRDFNQYSDDPETESVESFKFETGIESKTDLNTDLLKNISIKTKVQLFSSFEDIRVIDMIWDTLVTAKITKYFVVTLNILLNYDKDVADTLQMKEITAIGLSYSFI